jgi:hypothetical protein
MHQLISLTGQRLCVEDNWHQVLDDPAARSVRWARRVDRFNNQIWTKWHYTEGNGAFTACGESVVPFETDGSPEERDLVQIDCRRCLSRMSQG